MKVTPIAWTTMRQLPESVNFTRFREDYVTREYHGPDDLHEFAGRACYQSWHKPNPKTADTRDYLANIIAQGHGSVLEHGSVTFYVEGVSRALTHELIRHRHLSFSELSQRFVDVEHVNYVEPPLIRDQSNLHTQDELLSLWQDARSAYAKVVAKLAEDTPNASRKQIREAARAVMPNATETKIVVTGNLRAWRDVLAKRWHEAADAEIREFAGLILDHLRAIAPGSVQDIPTNPYK